MTVVYESLGLAPRSEIRLGCRFPMFLRAFLFLGFILLTLVVWGTFVNQIAGVD
jgi:hypothetical protein